MSSLRWRMWSALPLLGALAGVAGCGESGSTKAPEAVEGTAQALSQESQGAPGHEVEGPLGSRARPPFARPGPGGPELLLVAALHELELTKAQTAAIRGALDTALADRREHGPRDRAPFTALAAGVRAGTIDAPSVLAKVGGESRGAEEPGAAVAGALQTLHATLTKEQRRALMDAVAKRMEEHGALRGPRGGHVGHEGPLGQLLEGLHLTDRQRAAIDRALEPTTADHEAMKKRFEALHAEMRARIEGFAADAFDAKAFVAFPEGADAVGPWQHIERMVKDLAVVVPVLEPAQREALAALLEKGPPAPMGHPGEPPGLRKHSPRSTPAR
jgi:Spy/CpxP family protein refolding chaperone